MATKDRGRNQPPAMKMGGTIPPEWQEKIGKAARMVATIAWHDDRPPVGERSPIRDKVIAHAREALSDAPSDPMFTTPEALGVSPGDLDPGEPMATMPGIFRLVFAGFDWSNATVAESIMVVIERATDDELARPVPGAL